MQPLIANSGTTDVQFFYVCKTGENVHANVLNIVESQVSKKQMKSYK